MEFKLICHELNYLDEILIAMSRDKKGTWMKFRDKTLKGSKNYFHCQNCFAEFFWMYTLAI
jgi:hypothetical protein